MKIDLTGQRFGQLTVLSEAEDPRKGPHWNCKCDCGGEKVVCTSSLRRGLTRSCGCLQKESLKEMHEARKGIPQKHGLYNDPLYAVWTDMKTRCYNRNCNRWDRYGGRGIRICEEWRDDVKQFVRDMGATYKPGLQLDREDNDGNYELGNCRWVAAKVNARNRSSNRAFILKGKRYTLTDLLEMAEKQYGIPKSVAKARIYGLKWDIKKALTTPARKNKRHEESKP